MFRKRTVVTLSLLLAIAAVAAGCAPSVAPTPAVAEPIKIAVVGPMTGDAADYGHWLQRGTFLAAEEINKAGGVGGRKIELVLFDDLCQPAEAVMAGHRIAADESLFAVIGHVCSSATLAAGPIYDAAGLTVVTGSSTNPLVTEQGWTHLFRTITSDADQGPEIAKLGIEERALLELADLADLARIKGIGTVYSDLLEFAGVDTVMELAGRNPDNLYDRIMEVAADHSVRRTPRRPSRGEEFVLVIWESAPLSLPLEPGLNEVRVVLAERDRSRRTPVEVGEFEITVEPASPL